MLVDEHAHSGRCGSCSPAKNTRAKDTRPEAFVFATTTGKPIGASNLRRRMLAPAVALANDRLIEAVHAPLPAGLTPHSLRRMFASVLHALGSSPPVVMAEMGHTDPKLALAIYAKAMSRDEWQLAELRALVEGSLLADRRRAPPRRPGEWRPDARHRLWQRFPWRVQRTHPGDPRVRRPRGR
jgi:integrase-like protein